MKNIEYFYFPKNEAVFKKEAKGNIVRTIIVTLDGSIINSYTRKVNKLWNQTRKNNIETDHRVKDLIAGNYHIYSWIVHKETEFNLPSFAKEECIK